MATPGMLPSVSRPLGSEARLSASLGAPTSPIQVGQSPPHPACPSTACPMGPRDLASYGRLECQDQGVWGTSELSGLLVGEARLTECLFILPLPQPHVTFLVTLTGIKGQDFCLWAWPHSSGQPASHLLPPDLWSSLW